MADWVCDSSAGDQRTSSTIVSAPSASVRTSGSTVSVIAAAR
jgi:hypothetical protein